MATCHTYMSASLGTVTVNPSTGSLCRAFSSMVRARMDVALAEAMAMLERGQLCRLHRGQGQVGLSKF